MKKITNEKGAITLYVIISVLFLIGILMGAYAAVASQQTDQIDAEQKIREVYGQGTNDINAVYQSLILTTSLSDGSWNVQKQVNSPELLTGMTAVYWDTNNQMQELTMANTKVEWNNWYDYTQKKWANAITKDADGNISGYWVWVPRYAYKIESGLGTSTAGTISVKFLQGKTNMDSTGAQINTTYPTVINNAMTDYVVHPTFRNGTTNNFANGEWDKEIEGIWVAKFEAGYAMDKNGDGTSDITGGNNVKPVASSVKYTGKAAWAHAAETGTTNATLSARNWLDGIYADTTSTWLNGQETTIKYPVFTGKTISMNYINDNDIFKISRVLTENGNIYGFKSTDADSHMIKNSEWGAIAYLSKSQYGLGSTIMHINNVTMNSGGSSTQNPLTSAYGVTGYAGDSIGATMVVINSLTDTNAWYTSNGQKASCTGNITGIYDLAGGLFDSISAYVANGNSRLNSDGSSITYEDNILKTVSTKYTTVYPHNATSDNTTITSNATNLAIANQANYVANTNIFGDGIRETSTAGTGTTSWNTNTSLFAGLYYPFFYRGGSYMYKENGGTLTFTHDTGALIYSYGFRAVLIAK